MSQTKQGIIKHRQTMIARYGSYEAWKEHMREIASKGGSNAEPGNRPFAKDHDLAKRAGKLGGKISKRGKATPKVKEQE